MNLTLQRILHTPTCTLGTLTLSTEKGETFLAHTLEPPWRGNEQNVSCIPGGVYALDVVRSPRFKRTVLRFQDVPGRSDILIHIGNLPSETEGCVLVGQRLICDRTNWSLSDSTVTLNSIIRLCRNQTVPLLLKEPL